MKMARETRDHPAIQAELEVPRFLWKLVERYSAIRTDKDRLSRFWTQQTGLLEEFDKKNPTQHRATPAPSTNARFTPTPIPAMVAKDSRPPPEKIPPPQKAPNDHEDDDAEGSEEEPASKPAPEVKRVPLPRPIKQVPAPLPPAVAATEPAPAKKKREKELAVPVPAPLPVPKSTKGKEKERDRAPLPPTVAPTEPAPPKKRKEHKDPAEPAPAPLSIPGKKPSAPRPRPKKGKEVKRPASEEPSSDSDSSAPAPSPAGALVRAPPVNSGRLRDPPCVRCVKGGRTCYEQAGGVSACLFCAKVKMKCEPATQASDDEGPSKKKRKVNPAPVPTPAVVPTRRPAVDEPPAPVKKPAKRKPVREQSPNRVAGPSTLPPVPAAGRSSSPAGSSKRLPVPSGTKKKVIKSAEVVDTGSGSDDFGTWPVARRNFRDFEAYYG